MSALRPNSLDRQAEAGIMTSGSLLKGREPQNVGLYLAPELRLQQVFTFLDILGRQMFAMIK